MPGENRLAPDRRRAEDCAVLLDDLVPRVNRIEAEVHAIKSDGCAQRDNDVRRLDYHEGLLTEVFHEVKAISKALGDIKLNVATEVGAIRSWVLGGVLVVSFSVIGYLLVTGVSHLMKDFKP